MTTVGRVCLVGAGPGDPGLITVAGLERLREADVVVYDRLVSPRLLDHAPADAERVYVGKAPATSVGRGPSPDDTRDQSDINALLIEKAREGKRVVRLKGGDPFVFGRGGEEAEALRAVGVPFEVVPGVSSAVAVPAYAGIPVTHRGLASSFAVVTGHEDPAKADDAIDWAKLATAIDTLVLLMGVRTLPAIIEKLIAAGRPADTPAAVIQRGTTPDQRTVTGTLADIVARAEEAGIGAPAITVIGEVVRLRDTLAWFEDRPLFGKRVLITRTRRQASVLARLLTDEGAVPIELPAIEIEPSYDERAVAAALDRLVGGGYAWCVFTSANAVDVWFGLMRERPDGQAPLDARAFGGVRVGAIGPATAEALAERGIAADAVPNEYIAEAVVEALREALPWGGEGATAPESETPLPARPEALEGPSGVTAPRVLLPRAEGARPELVDGLAALGATVDEVTLYRAAMPAQAPAEALSLLRDGGVDIVTFTSSSTVRNLAALLDGDVECLRADARPSGRKTVIACIGPITAATARELGLRVDVVAAEHTVPGLVRALRGYVLPRSAEETKSGPIGGISR